MNKSEVYCNLLDLFGRISYLSKTKSTKNVQVESLAHEMMRIGMNIALLGSDEVLKCYIDWRGATLTGETEKIINGFSRLMLAMRKDLRDTQIDDYEKMTDMYVEVGQ